MSSAQTDADAYRGRATHMALVYMASSKRLAPNSAWLRVQIEDETYSIALQPTPGRFTFSKTNAAPIARDCVQPCTHVIQQDLQWKHSIERIKTDQDAGGPLLHCTITRSNTAQGAVAPRAENVAGQLQWKFINELALKSNGWLLMFRYTRCKNTIRLMSAEYNVKLGEDAARELTLLHSAQQNKEATQTVKKQTATVLDEAAIAIQQFKRESEQIAAQTEK